MRRVLLFATTTGYQTRMFGESASRLGIQLVFATDRCDQLDDPWWDHAIPIRFHDETASVDAVLRSVEHNPVHGILAVGDRATVIAARVAQALGLPGHPPEAAAAARDKRLTRERLAAAGLPVPRFQPATVGDDAGTVARQLHYPVVIKPASLSGSRGVIRASSPDEFIAAFDRLRRLLESEDVRVMQDAATSAILIEEFIEGREYALEGLLDRGRLHEFALFDKPDPLDGPFFEETIYVTPSRAAADRQHAIAETMAAAARALGLHHGPIHAECRVNSRGVFTLEVAARPIGGLCARALAFEAGGGRLGLEELLLRHAVGELPARCAREAEASGVMMIPIPRAGIYKGVQGLDRAAEVPGICSLEITAKSDQRLVPLPEGASYLGFIFARASTPEAVEQALRDAHARLDFVIDRALPVAVQ